MRSENGMTGLKPEGSLSPGFLWLGLITVLGAVLRFYHLGFQSLWMDEAYSVFVAGHSPGDIFTLQVHDSSPPLYYLMLHLWVKLWGYSEFAVRSLSVIAGIAMIPATAELARRIFRDVAPFRHVPLLAAFFVAVSPVQIYFSQETRMYTISGLLALVAVLGFLNARAGSRSGWVFIPAMAALNWLHNYGWFIWGALILWSLFRSRKLWIHHGLIAVLSVPWLVSALMQAGANTTAWIPRPGWLALYTSLLCFAGKFQFYSGTGYSRMVLPGIVIILLIMVISGITASRRGTRIPQAWFWILVLPLTLPIIISQLKPIYYPERHEFIFHAFILLYAAGIGVFFRKKWVLLLPFIFILGQAGLLTRYYAPAYSKSNDRSAAEKILELNPGPSDLIITTDLTATPLAYYLGNEPLNLLAFPRGTLGWLPGEYMRGDKTFVTNELQWLEGIIRESPETNQVILVVANRLAGDEMLIQWLNKRFLPGDTVTVPAPRLYNQVREIRVYRIGDR